MFNVLHLQDERSGDRLRGRRRAAEAFSPSDSQEHVGAPGGVVEVIASPNCLSVEAKSSQTQSDLFVNPRSHFLPP